jgi:hypothetical protein
MTTKIPQLLWLLAFSLLAAHISASGTSTLVVDTQIGANLAFGYQARFSPNGTQLAYGGANGTVEIVPAPASADDAAD